MRGRKDRRHPLPESAEARHDEIPESAEREKGVGDEGEEIIQPTTRVTGASSEHGIDEVPEAADPDGRRYQ